MPGVYYGPHNTQLEVVNLQFSVVIYGVEGPEQTIISCDYNGVKGAFGLAEKGGMNARVWVSCTRAIYFFFPVSVCCAFTGSPFSYSPWFSFFTSPLEHSSQLSRCGAVPGPAFHARTLFFNPFLLRGLTIANCTNDSDGGGIAVSSTGDEVPSFNLFDVVIANCTYADAGLNSFSYMLLYFTNSLILLSVSWRAPVRSGRSGGGLYFESNPTLSAPFSFAQRLSLIGNSAGT